ncbi:phage baseplate assembly protein V, partial [Pantoea ananatis]|uniref:phage baseplate assembly protein V n=1 Tax=Pantoea ananas TaxID=553 RepID=UPI001B30E193
NALHISFPDSAVLQYNPDDSSFLMTGAKTAYISVAEKTTWDCPDTEFLGKVTAETLSITQGGEMHGNIEHSGGKFSSNGVVVDDHEHDGVKPGDGKSGGPVK